MLAPTSISCSWPTVAKKWTFGVLPVRTADEEALVDCASSETAQLYAMLLHSLVAGSDLMFTNTASKGGYAPTLFTQCRIQASENPS
jgi:hypothetical protein